MNNIVGYENEKKEASQLRNMLINSKTYRESGIRIPRGIVFYGEPGVGKTQLAKTISGNGINLIEFRAATCCEEDFQLALQTVFAEALRKQPSVLLLDELDKIAGTSANFFMEDNNDVQKILLQELDNFTDNDDVLVVATCNDIEVLGSALLRPGRFDRIVHMQTPDEETREKILRLYFGKIKLNQNIDFKYLARIIPGYTGAQIECLANETGIFAIEEDLDAITIDDIRGVMNKIAFNGSEKSPIKDLDKLRKIAIHEAGHVLLALELAPDNIFGASVLPQGDSNGHIHFVNPDEGVCSVKEIENEVAVLLGGHVAERVSLGEYMLGSGSDLSQAECRLRYLAVNQAAYGYESIVAINMRQVPISINVREELCSAIINKFNEIDALVENIINKRIALFNTIVENLIERKTLSREELFEIKDSCSIVIKSA